MHLKAKRIGLFIGLTFFLSWALWLAFFGFGGELKSAAGFALTAAGMFMPMISAILVQKVLFKETTKEPLGINWKINRWWLAAWIFPPLIAAAAMVASLFIPGVTYSPDMAGFFARYTGILPPEQLQEMEKQIAALPIHIFWITLLQGMMAGATVNALFGFGEELGWRGFLQRELAYLGFWKSAAVIGFIWGIWHAPMILQGFNYPEHPVAGVFMMIIFCILYSPIFSYIRLKSRSVIAAAVMHGSLNGTAGLAVMMVAGGSDLLVGVTGVAGLFVLLLVNVLILVLDQKFTDCVE